MNKSYLLLLLFLTYFLSGCEAIGAIFKTGVWTGIILVVAVVALILYFFSRRKR